MRLRQIWTSIGLIALCLPGSADDGKRSPARERTMRSEIAVTDASGVPVITFAGDTAAPRPPSQPGQAFEIPDVNHVTFYSETGVGTLSGACGESECFGWLSGDHALIIGQPRTWAPPVVSHGTGFVLIDLVAGSGDEEASSSSIPWMIDHARHGRSCRTCGHYPAHCANFETWSCVPGPCPSCTRCTSRAC